MLTSMKQFLNDQARCKCVDERKMIRESLRRIRHLPPGHTFSSLSRLLAQLCFEAEENNEGVYNLIQSHGISMRQKAFGTHCNTKRKENVIDKKILDFREKLDGDYKGVLQRLKEMPKEWTIVQLTCAIDKRWRYGLRKNWTPVLHVVRMECGKKTEYKPMHLYLQPPSQARNYAPLNEMKNILSINDTDGFKHDPVKYWSVRGKVDKSIKEVVKFMNEHWFAPVAPFLSGQLLDGKLRRNIKASVDRVLNQIEKYADNPDLKLPDIAVCLIHKAAENIHLLNYERFSCIVERALRLDKRLKCFMEPLLDSYGTFRQEFFKSLIHARRNPVILIVDEILDVLPMECLDTLNKHPVSRTPSFQLLYGLFTVHRNSIKNGHKIVHSDSGLYLVNPEGNLKQMENRMTSFMTHRAPKSWTGIIGKPLTSEISAKSLAVSDIFVFMGHGNGVKHWKASLWTSGIPFASLLFGCRSAGLKIFKGLAEVDCGVNILQTEACPCIIGMLWPVTDKDTDLVAQSILDEWLPKIESKLEEKQIGKSRGKKSTVCKKKIAAHSVEPDLLQAVTKSRQVSTMKWTGYALVARGLPVFIQ